MTSPPGRIVTRLLVIAALAAPLAGCTDDGDAITLPSPSPTLSSPASSAEPSPSPSPSGPFAVPDEITTDYVERVLNEINRLDADITVEILEGPVDQDAQELPAPFQEALSDLYEQPLLEFSRRGRLDLLRSPDQREALVPVDEFGQQRVEAEAVLSAERCVLARVTRDFTQVDAEPDTESSTLAFMFLVRVDGANTTGWKLASLLESDVVAGSTDEEELRTLAAKDVEAQAPEVCR